jgi:putative oxidoreductase
MTIVRRIARPLLAAVFVQHGLDRVRHPASRVEAARPLVAKIAGPTGLPNDPEMLVRANGAAMAGAGTLLAIGRMPRLSALVLAASLVPSTYVDHPFWETKDPEQRRAQQVHFLKNLGLLGGVLLAAVDTEGRPGLAWRTRHASGRVQKTARRAKKDARLAAKHAKLEAKEAARRAGGAVHR